MPNGEIFEPNPPRSGLHHRRDAWAKHKDLDSYEAKWRYVDALLKVILLTHAMYVCSNLYQVLRRYSDKTVARDLVGELESYGGDPVNLVHSGMIICCFVAFNVIKSLCRTFFEVPGL